MVDTVLLFMVDTILLFMVDTILLLNAAFSTATLRLIFCVHHASFVNMLRK
jgi:hypothetical protein